MTVYIVTGKLGGGKSLVVVSRLLEHYLARRKPVATNIDLWPWNYFRSGIPAELVRLPDFPTVADLEAIGRVHDGRDEGKNGAVALDECGVLLNAREWGDKGRQALIDWLLHSRKLGWDVYLIVQSLELLDKQVRSALSEYWVICRRLDRLNVPVVSTVCKLFTGGEWGPKLPRLHMATVRYGIGPSSMHSETWTYRGSDMFACYDTAQQLKRGPSPFGAYCVLKPWDHKPAPTLLQRLRALVVGVPRARPAPRPKLPVIAKIASALPPGERIAHVRRMERLGLLRASCRELTERRPAGSA